MNILVCISHVPDTAAKINFTADGSAFDPAGVQFVINPYDEFALEEAIRIKSALTDSEITVFSLGPESVEESLKRALALSLIHI